MTSTNMSSMLFVVREAIAPRRDTAVCLATSSTTNVPTPVSAAVSHACTELWYHWDCSRSGTRRKGAIIGVSQETTNDNGNATTSPPTPESLAWYVAA